MTAAAVEKSRMKPWVLVFSAWTVLVLVGLLMAISAPSVVAQERFGDALFYFKRQALFTLLAAVGVFVTAHVSYRVWLFPRVVQGLFFGTTAGLILVLWSAPIREVHRWLHFHFFTFQPSELAKLALVIYAAYQAHRVGARKFRNPAYGLIPVTLVCTAWGVLIIQEPDLGNTLLLFLIAGFILFLGETPLRYLLIPVLAAGLVFGYLVFTHNIPEYWMKRIQAYVDPGAYARTLAYQRNQAIVALGNGGFTGVGYGRSLQKIYYLPESETDYVFAVLGEELGWLGGSASFWPTRHCSAGGS